MRLLVILTLGLLSTLPLAFGQEPTLSRQLRGKPGSDINVGVFVTTKDDCSVAPPPSVQQSSPPSHGKLTVSHGQIKVPNCPAAELPAFIATYRSQPDYVGQDKFAIEIVTAGGRKLIQEITVTLTKAGD